MLRSIFRLSSIHLTSLSLHTTKHNLSIAAGSHSVSLNQTLPSPFKSTSIRLASTFNQMIRNGLPDRKRKIKSPALDGCPQKKVTSSPFFPDLPLKGGLFKNICSETKETEFCSKKMC